MDSAHEEILTLPAGSQQVGSLKLFGVRLLKVKRDGVGYDIIYSSAPNVRQVLHSPVSGRLKFHVPAGTSNEDIYVLIKD
jgi:hypothetical protein